MKEPTPEQLDKLAEKLIAMVNEAVAGKARELSEIIEADGLDRCGICYWPLAKDGKTGCVRGRCSMVGDDPWGTTQRRIHRESIEKRMEWLEEWVTEVYLKAILSILKEVSVSTIVPAENQNKIGEQ